MAVIEGVSDAYILSKGSTFKWDTCGPHAILLGKGAISPRGLRWSRFDLLLAFLGGGVTQPDGVPLRYHQPDEGCKGAKKVRIFACWWIIQTKSRRKSNRGDTVCLFECSKTNQFISLYHSGATARDSLLGCHQSHKTISLLCGRSSEVVVKRWVTGEAR